MRTTNLLALASALALSLSLVPTQTAEACGNYGMVEFAPSAFPVSRHFIPRAKDDHRRAFVLLGGEAPSTTAWTQLAPRSYDPTLIAAAPHGKPMTFTLVGRTGTRVVTASKYFYLKQTFSVRKGSTLAIEIDVNDDEDFEIALAGSVSNTTWSEPGQKAATAADAEWLSTRGIAGLDPRDISMQSFGSVDSLTYYDSRSDAFISVIRRGSRELARRTGWATGTLTVDGKRHAVVSDQATTRVVRI